MQPPELRRVWGNLIELYAAAKEHKNPENLLIATPDQERIFMEETLEGGFYSLYYFFRPIFDLRCNRKENLYSAIMQTHLLFMKCLQEAEVAFEIYKKRAFEEESLCHSIYLKAARHRLYQWDFSTAPFTKFLDKPNSTPIKNWLESCIPLSLRPCFTEEEVLEKCRELRRFQKVLNLMRDLDMSMPETLLLQIASGEEIEYLEKKQLEHFVNSIEKGDLSVRKLHNALKILVYHSNLDHSKRGADVVTLELAIMEAGSKVFLKDDEKQIGYRDSLNPGDSVKYKGKQLILGERLNGHPYGYEVVNDKSVAVFFGNNCALPALQKRITKQSAWCLPPLKQKVDPHGRFFIVEQLEPLMEIGWNSKHKINDPDKKTARPIKKLLQWLVEQEKTTTNFDPENFGYTLNGKIRSIKVLVEGKFDFNGMVKFAEKVAQGNQVVKVYLLKHLYLHKYAKYYFLMLKNALDDHPMDLADFAAAANIPPSDGEVIEQANTLFDQIYEVRTKLYEKLSEYLKKKKNITPEKMRFLMEKVNDIVEEVYVKKGCLGFLPSNFEDIALKRFDTVFKG